MVNLANSYSLRHVAPAMSLNPHGAMVLRKAGILPVDLLMLNPIKYLGILHQKGIHARG